MCVCFYLLFALYLNELHLNRKLCIHGDQISLTNSLFIHSEGRLNKN
jgi:hypothetical protein